MNNVTANEHFNKVDQIFCSNQDSYKGYNINLMVQSDFDAEFQFKMYQGLWECTLGHFTMAF